MRLTLRWNWAGAADATLIVARQGAAPQGPDDPAAIKVTVYRLNTIVKIAGRLLADGLASETRSNAAAPIADAIHCRRIGTDGRLARGISGSTA